MSKNIFKFIDDIENLSIYYGCKSIIYSLQFIKYYDSDFTDDKEFSKSIYGYVFKFVKGSISWKSKRASIIILSMLKVKTNIFIKGIQKVFLDSWPV